MVSYISVIRNPRASSGKAWAPPVCIAVTLQRMFFSTGKKALDLFDANFSGLLAVLAGLVLA